MIGGPGISQVDPLRYASYVLNTALGGGMSSRLFQEVREKRGRVYSIYSFMSSFIDCGYFAVYAGTNPEWVDEVIEVTLGEIKQVAREGLDRSELARAKSQLKGNMLLGMESTDSRMNRLARNEIYFRRDIPLEELAAEIDKVTHDQVVELATLVFVRPDGAGAAGRFEGRKLGPKSSPSSGKSSPSSSRSFSALKRALRNRFGEALHRARTIRFSLVVLSKAARVEDLRGSRA